jgi:hypothetical protein
MKNLLWVSPVEGREGFPSIISRWPLPIFIVLLLLGVACGPGDYQKSIKDFQDASGVVIASTEAFLKNANRVEQELQIDQAVFLHEELDAAAIRNQRIISDDSIQVRTKALNALSAYLANLALLAEGKDAATIGDNTKSLADSLQKVAEDAKKIPGIEGSFANDPKFPGLVSSAATAIGSVAQLIVEHKARKQIEASIRNSEGAISALIQHIGDDCEAAFLRLRNQYEQYTTLLLRAYNHDRASISGPDAVAIDAALKANFAQRASVEAANPRPAIEKMKACHQALVNYVKSSKRPKDLAELKDAVSDFVNAVTPLGKAIGGIVKSI